MSISIEYYLESHSEWYTLYLTFTPEQQRMTTTVETLQTFSLSSSIELLSSMISLKGPISYVDGHHRRTYTACWLGSTSFSAPEHVHALHVTSCDTCNFKVHFSIMSFMQNGNTDNSIICQSQFVANVCVVLLTHPGNVQDRSHHS